MLQFCSLVVTCSFYDTAYVVWWFEAVHQQQLGLYGAIVRWRFYHFAPQIKLNWIKRVYPRWCGLLSHNCYVLACPLSKSCISVWVSLRVSLSEAEISGPWELLVTWLSPTIWVSSSALSFVYISLDKIPSHFPFSWPFDINLYILLGRDQGLSENYFCKLCFNPWENSDICKEL